MTLPCPSLFAVGVTLKGESVEPKGRAIFNKTLLIALNIFAKLIKKAKTKEGLQEALFTISIQQSFY